MSAPASESPIVAVIPARGGSKRIPRKNIKPLAGVPLIARTIATLRATSVIDRIVVTTDDDEIAEVARDAGAEVPFTRPAALADDHAATRPVIQHAITEIERAQGAPVEHVCAVYPAAVLIEPADLVDAYRMLIERNPTFVVSSVAYLHPIQRAFTTGDDGAIRLVDPQVATMQRTQDFPAAYHDAGQFYWGSRDTWLGPRELLGPEAIAHVLPRWRAQDLDTPEDWEVVERWWHAAAK